MMTEDTSPENLPMKEIKGIWDLGSWVEVGETYVKASIEERHKIIINLIETRESWETNVEKYDNIVDTLIGIIGIVNGVWYRLDEFAENKSSQFVLSFNELGLFFRRGVGAERDFPELPFLENKKIMVGALQRGDESPYCSYLHNNTVLDLFCALIALKMLNARKAIPYINSTVDILKEMKCILDDAYGSICRSCYTEINYEDLKDACPNCSSSDIHQRHPRGKTGEYYLDFSNGGSSSTDTTLYQAKPLLEKYNIVLPEFSDWYLLTLKTAIAAGEYVINYLEEPNDTHDETTIERRIKELNSTNGSSFAVEELGRISDKRAVKPLVKIIEGDIAASDSPSADLYFRRNATKALGRIGDARAVEPLIHALKDEDSEVVCTVREALKKLGHEVKK